MTRRTSPTPSPKCDFKRRRNGWCNIRVQRESTRSFHVGLAQTAPGPRLAGWLHSRLRLAPRSHVPTFYTSLAGPGAGGDARRPLPGRGRWHPACGSPDPDRAYRTQLRKPRGVQGYSWMVLPTASLTARSTVHPEAQKTDGQADQQQPAVVGRCAGRYEAPARDLRRRRE